jgi:hypothetical protein
MDAPRTGRTAAGLRRDGREKRVNERLRHVVGCVFCFKRPRKKLKLCLWSFSISNVQIYAPRRGSSRVLWKCWSIKPVTRIIRACAENAYDYERLPPRLSAYLFDALPKRGDNRSDKYAEQMERTFVRINKPQPKLASTDEEGGEDKMDTS